METYALTIHFAGQYIGNPYWPEMYRLIEITKESGMNRSRATQNKRKALEEHLRAKGLTLADYEALKLKAERPFHINARGNIIIPAERVLSFLVACCDEVRAAQRACSKEQVRSRFVASDFVTDKTEPDGVWSRFATVTAGAGNKLSNQRGLRENPYIEDFKARGTLTFDPQFVDKDALSNMVRWGGQFVGIGASRKMGKGRFQLMEFAKQALAIAA